MATPTAQLQRLLAQAPKHYALKRSVFSLDYDQYFSEIEGDTANHDGQVERDWGRSNSDVYFLNGIRLGLFKQGQVELDISQVKLIITEQLLSHVQPSKRQTFLQQALPHLHQGGLQHLLGRLLSARYNQQRVLQESDNPLNVLTFSGEYRLYAIPQGIAICEVQSLSSQVPICEGIMDDRGKVTYQAPPFSITAFSTLTLGENDQLVVSPLGIDYQIESDDEDLLTELAIDRSLHERLSGGPGMATKVVKALSTTATKLMGKVKAWLPTGESAVSDLVSAQRQALSQRQAELSDALMVANAKLALSDREQHNSSLQSKKIEAQLVKKADQLRAANTELNHLNQQVHEQFSTVFHRFSELKASVEVSQLDLSALIGEATARKRALSVLLDAHNTRLGLIERSHARLPSSKRLSHKYTAEKEMLSQTIHALDIEQKAWTKELALLEGLGELPQIGLALNKKKQLPQRLAADTQAALEFSLSPHTRLVQAAVIDPPLLRLTKPRLTKLCEQAQLCQQEAQALDTQLIGASESSLTELQVRLIALQQRMVEVSGEIEAIVETGQEPTDPNLFLPLTAHIEEVKRLCLEHKRAFLTSDIDQLSSRIQTLTHQLSQRQPIPKTVIPYQLETVGEALVNQAQEQKGLLQTSQQQAFFRLQQKVRYTHLMAGAASDDDQSKKKIIKLLVNYYKPRGWVFGWLLHPNRHHKASARSLVSQLNGFLADDEQFTKSISEEIQRLAIDETVNHRGSYFRRLVLAYHLLNKETEIELEESTQITEFTI